jgi:hypothetical protein
MAQIKGRATRPKGVATATVLLQGRVPQEIRDEVTAAAEASGVSMAYYLEQLVRDLVAERGAMPTVAKPAHYRQSEELSIPAA